MKQVSTPIEAAFDFCERCLMKEIETVRVSMPGQEVHVHRCEMQKYCENAVRLYREEQEGKENERREPSGV